MIQLFLPFFYIPMKTSISQFTLQKVFEISEIIKKNTRELSTAEEVCQSVTKSLYQTFSNSTGENEFALCRIFKSCSFDDFPPELKKHVRKISNEKFLKETKHIALLGTFGEKKEWCSISKSKNHKAFPLNNPQAVQNFPMMLALFNQIGFDISINKDTGSLLFLKKEDREFGLFMIKDAVGNSLIPDQDDFVIPFGIKSVFGFGGMFSTGNIFATIFFSKKKINRQQAEMFHSLIPAFKYAQIENELKGRIFKGIENNAGKNKFNKNLDLDIEKEKANTLNEELIRANKALLNHEEILNVQNLALEKLATGKPLTEILDVLTLGAEQNLEAALASILLLDNSGSRLNYGSTPSFSQAMKDAFHGMLIGPLEGSCGTAAYSKQLVIAEDISTDPRWTKFRDFAESQGLKSCYAAPILGSDGSVLGTFALTFTKVKPLTDIGFEIIRSSAHIASLAIERKRHEENLKSSLGLLNSIKNAQSKFIIDSYSKQLFDELLNEILHLTQSEFGFIGEIKNQNGKPFLKTHTITNIAWNKETRKLYDQTVHLGMEFHNLDTLFGAVITTGKPVISYDPTNDPRSCGLPNGHPPLKAFLGIPFFHSGNMIGMFGMANRPEGYSEQMIDHLQPFLFTCSNLLQAWRNDQQRKDAEFALKNRTIELGQKNLALKEVLAQIEIEKNQLIKTVSANVNKLLIPSLEKLARKATRIEQKYINLLKRNLREITSGLGSNKIDTHLGLTPREFEVCNMVNGGLNTKEIASILNLSIRTVETHRLNIRKKLPAGKFEKP